MKYIDIHCHLDYPGFDSDRNEVISRAKEKEIGMIVVGTDIESSKKAIAIAEEGKDIWASIGLHPALRTKEKFDLITYKRLAENPKVVGIGECGLDYYRNGYETKAGQLEIFERHIFIANEVKKPLILHIRSGLQAWQDAYKDSLEFIKRHATVSGNVHFFAGDWEEAKQFLDLGFRLSFTGVITFTRDYDEVIKNTPLDMIMSETDSPFVTPIPHRGERNEPSYVIEVAEKIAEIRGENKGKVLSSLIDNAKKLFSI